MTNLSNIDFERAINELISNYFYLFSGIYSSKGCIPENREMLRIVRAELNFYFGRQVSLSSVQRKKFNDIFTYEYGLIVNERSL